MEELDQHIPLIYRVIGQMGLKGDTAEEAFSEGLVAITIASTTFNPDKDVPLANWLAMNVRWSLRRWIAKQHQNIPLEYLPSEPEHPEIPIEFNEVIDKMQSVLSEKERKVLLAHAYGFTGKRISEVMKISEKQVTQIKQRAQRKLKKEFD